MIRDALAYVARNYLTATKDPFTDHPVAQYLRHDAPKAIAQVLSNPAYSCRGSAGQSTWADIPWIGVFHPAVTSTARDGYYVVYLFDALMENVHLCLEQGTTRVRDEFKAATRDALARFSGLMRDRLPEAKGRFLPGPVKLHGSSSLALDYEPAIALRASYQCANLPSEPALQADLVEMVRLYTVLFSRGGRDSYADADDTDPKHAVANQDIVEQRRYRLHRKLERNPNAAKRAKQAHGYICQCCGFDFELIFGITGRDYIEAHHLIPLSSLPEDKPVSQDPKTDFAVLCANCHRMIHRKDAPKTVGELRKIARVMELSSLLAKLRGDLNFGS